MALVAAAVAAARASMPPPSRPTGDVDVLSANLALPPQTYTGPPAGTVPLAGAIAGRIAATGRATVSIRERARLADPADGKTTLAADRAQLASVAPIAPKPFGRRAVHQPMVIAVAVLLASATVFASVRALRAVKGPAHPAVLADAASRPLPLPPPAVNAADESEHSDRPAPSSQPESPASSSSAVPDALTPAAAKLGLGRRSVPVPTKRPPADPRPKFLKSWN
jgi:hypothetical protein